MVSALQESSQNKTSEISVEKQVKIVALQVIHEFPKSKNGEPFLTLKNGRKLFFKIFINKYGLDGEQCKYNDLDVMRRVRLVEFFDCFVKDYGLKIDGANPRGKKTYIIESRFYRMVIIDIGGEQQGTDHGFQGAQGWGTQPD